MSIAPVSSGKIQRPVDGGTFPRPFQGTMTLHVDGPRLSVGGRDYEVLGQAPKAKAVIEEIMGRQYFAPFREEATVVGTRGKLSDPRGGPDRDVIYALDIKL